MCLNTGKEQNGQYSGLIDFIEKHDSFILTTHDPADADGLGAQMVLRCILQALGKKCRIINASPIPKQFKRIDPHGVVEQWEENEHGTLPEQSAVLMVDTADMHNIGYMRDPVCRATEVFILDHHEKLSNSHFAGIYDSSAASTCEMAVELSGTMGIPLDSDAAFAAYLGIAYDTGFFAYPKTAPRTFQAALTLLGLGVKPNEVYQYLNENVSVIALLLQKKALSSLTLHCQGRVAVQVLYPEDFTEIGAVSDDTDGFVNFPLKAHDIIVSLLVKESIPGKIRCSLRSKEGTVNVSEIAHEFGGGGHINASGFKSSSNIDMTLTLALAKISNALDKL